MIKRAFFVFILLLAIVLFLVNCSGPKIIYNYPRGLSEEKLKEVKQKAKRGKKMFKSYCSKCHLLFPEKNDTTQPFNRLRMEVYTLTFLKGDYKNHAFTQHLSVDQLMDILFFVSIADRKE